LHADGSGAEGGRFVCEQMDRDGFDRFHLLLSATALSFKKEEVNAQGAAVFRNAYVFRRAGAPRPPVASQ
jgi:hypothetical protein